MPGWWSAFAPSWGYHGDDGRKFEYVDTKEEGVPYCETYGPGDIVGCGVDFMKGTIYYTKNGKSLRTCNAGLSSRLSWKRTDMMLFLATAFENVRGRLFPVVGMLYHAAKIRVNFGHDENNPFMYSGWQD